MLLLLTRASARHHAAGVRGVASAAPAQIDALYQRAITPGVCQHLQSNGFAVVDGVLPTPVASALLEELRALHASGATKLNCTHLVKGNVTQLLQKQHIWEAELTLDAAVREAVPHFRALDDARGLATMLSLLMPQLQLDSQAVKLQVNAGGGGCFPMHFDSDEALDGRRVTALFYLNPKWDPRHGGQLRLFPFPRPPVDVEPLQGRMVLFSSQRMLHRVLPCLAERYCFTVWLSQSRGRQAIRGAPAPLAAQVPPDGAPQEQVWRFLLSPPIRKHVVKLVYADEWLRSLEESHPQSAAREAALQAFHHESAAIKRALARFLPSVEALAAATHPGSAAPASVTGEVQAAARQLPSVVWF